MSITYTFSKFDVVSLLGGRTVCAIRSVDIERLTRPYDASLKVSPGVTITFMGMILVIAGGFFYIYHLYRKRRRNRNEVNHIEMNALNMNHGNDPDA